MNKGHEVWDISEKLMIYMSVRSGENKSLQISLIRFKKFKTEQDLRMKQEHSMIRLTDCWGSFITGKFGLNNSVEMTIGQ